MKRIYVMINDSRMCMFLFADAFFIFRTFRIDTRTYLTMLPQWLAVEVMERKSFILPARSTVVMREFIRFVESISLMSESHILDVFPKRAQCDERILHTVKKAPTEILVYIYQKQLEEFYRKYSLKIRDRKYSTG